jgi:hypothetical protein
MMKRYLSILVPLFLLVGCTNKHSTKLNLSHQNSNPNCSCSKDTLLAHIISCKPELLDNGAKLYWNYNCDSSWITFENRAGEKKTIFELGDGLVQLTNRLGHTNFKEFSTTFLYTNKVISGCCDPDDYYLYSKTSGKLIKKFGAAIYVSDNNRMPFLVSVTNSNYDHISRFDFYSLTLYNIDTQKSFKIKIKKGDIEKGMKNNNYMFPEFVFDTCAINDQTLTIRYFTEKYIKGTEPNYKSIKINLKQYSQEIGTSSRNALKEV